MWSSFAHRPRPTPLSCLFYSPRVPFLAMCRYLDEVAGLQGVFLRLALSALSHGTRPGLFYSLTSRHSPARHSPAVGVSVQQQQQLRVQ